MIDSYRLLPRNTENGKRYVFDFNRNGNADAGEAQLVRQSQDGWQPVDQLDGALDRFTFEKDFGIWQDQEISHKEGVWPFNRRKVVDRPVDGKIDADEVTQTTWIRYPGTDAFRLGGEITKDSEGRFEYDRHTIRYGAHYIIGNSDIEWQRQYREEDANWKVAKKA